MEVGRGREVVEKKYADGCKIEPRVGKSGGGEAPEGEMTMEANQRVKMGRLLAACAAVWLAAGSFAQTVYTFSTPGLTSPRMWAISADGSAVAGNFGPGPGSGGFRWTTTGGFQVLPGFIPDGQLGMSRDGQVVAGTNPSITLGLRWTAPGTLLQVGPFGNGTQTEFDGVSPDGVVCTGRTRLASGAIRAFTWTQSGGMNLLPAVAGSFNSTPLFTSLDGSVVYGWVDQPAGANAAVIWSGGTITNLASLYPGIAFCTSGSDDGRTLWGYGFGGGGTEILRYQLTRGGWAVNFNAQYPGATGTSGGPCVADGTALAGSAFGGSLPVTTPFLYSTDLGFVNLATWLPSVGVSSPGLTVTNGAIVSSDGTAMCGTGTLNGQQVGWVAQGVPCLHKPSVTLDLPSLVEECAGSTVTLSASGGGNYTGTLRFRWKKNGVNLSNGASGSGSTYAGATSPTLSVSGASPADDGMYTCTITNPCGSVSTSAAQVLVYGLPVVTSNPAPVTACPVGSATFTLGASNVSTYIWERDTGTGWVAISDGTSTDLATGLTWTASGATTGTLQLSSIYFGTLTQVPIRCSAANYCRSLRPVQTTLYRESTLLINSASNDYFCHYSPATFTTSLASGNATGYNWQFYDTFYGMWLYLSDGFFIDANTGMTANISGAMSPSMSFNIQTLGTIPNQLYFRCAVTGTCTLGFCAPGILTVCRGDYNCDGVVDFFDYVDFVDGYTTGAINGDFNGDGSTDFFDYLDFVDSFTAGC